ncbi:MAG: PucC family protein [Pseudomonadota bacterium]
MASFKEQMVHRLVNIGPRFLPFADAASKDVPLSQLLRLSLFQVTVGMALVLLVGTLNRVMIVELRVPATLVGVMLALPILFAPLRILIGYRSDIHHSALGWRRVPFIWKGTMYQFGGFAVMPFALLVLSGYAEAVDAPIWLGHGSAALAFLMVGAGVHMVQTVGLALATDLVSEDQQPNVVGLMYVMLLVGMIVSAFVFGALLENYTPGRLIQVIQGAAVVTIVLNGIALWKQEGRNRTRAMSPKPNADFAKAWSELSRGHGMLLLLVIIGFGTLGFGMADVILEPYGGQVLQLSVAQTTKLTAVLAGGTLIGFAVASNVLRRGMDPITMSWIGAALGVPGFVAIILAAYGGQVALFILGIGLVGLGAGLFGHGTLTQTMRSAPKSQIGLALGAWGAVQATAAGIGVAVAGIMRDVIIAQGYASQTEARNAYIPVFALELVCLVLAIMAFAILSRKITGQRRVTH